MVLSSFVVSGARLVWVKAKLLVCSVFYFSKFTSKLRWLHFIPSN